MRVVFKFSQLIGYKAIKAQNIRDIVDLKLFSKESHKLNLELRKTVYDFYRIYRNVPVQITCIKRNNND